MKTHYKFILLLFLSSCAHTIDLRTSHFLTPTVSEGQWGGSVSLSGAQPSKITLVNDITTNPPTRTGVKINDDITVSDLFMLSGFGFDLNLSPYPSLEIFIDNYTLGLKWQFLNYGFVDDGVVGSFIGAYGGKSTTIDVSSSGQPGSHSTSNVSTLRLGASVGYQFVHAFKWSPYLSIIHEQHNAKTEVDNSYGHFGAYENSGRHEVLSVGASTVGKGLKMALEYNFIQLNWDDVNANQNTVGFLIGGEW